MKKLLLIFLILFNPILVSAEINECTTDVYFANGILTDREVAKTNAFEVLKPAIIDMLGTEKFNKQIGKVDYAYNNTYGFFPDGLETFLQKFGWQSLADTLFNASHGVDLGEQINAYKASINAGHKVLAVAHSQGNLFTKEAYDALSSSMQGSFEAVSVASPMSADIKPNTQRIDWDNDIVPRIATGGFSSSNNLQNSVRKIDWLLDYTQHAVGFVPPLGSEPNGEYCYISGLGTTDERDCSISVHSQTTCNFEAKEGGINSSVHAFTFYMGQPLGIDDGDDIRDPFTNNALVETTAKANIMNAISEKLIPWDRSISTENGIIEVTLKWGSSSINMDLSSAIGTKDISDIECPLEHYYVKSENDVIPGIYAVHVSNAGDVDPDSLPQIMTLKIFAPGALSVFDFNITAADMLSLGHVADIEISEKREVTAVYVPSNNYVSVVQNVYQASDSEYIKYIYEIESRLKQATLGPLSNADITLTNAINFQSNMPFYESSTSGGSSILTSGVFYFTSEVLNSLQKDAYYVLGAHGGDDIDANDDGYADNTPTHNLGTIHAVANERRIKNENFKITILSEVAFQLTKELMNEELNATLLQEKLDDIAKRLLIADVDGNNEINYDDILYWLPRHDKDKLRKPYDAYYEPVIQKIYKDEDIYEESYDLAYKPYFTKGTFDVDENAAAGTSIGKLSLELVDEDVHYYVKENNELFDIAMDGNITLKSGTLDYETQQLYTLNVFANVEGVENSYTLNIRVNNIIELPVLASASFSISISSIEQGLPIGTIPIKVSDGITQIILEGEGSELFNVDKNGTITAKDTSYGHSVILQAYAINALGESERVTINIIKRIISSVDTPHYANDVTLSTDGTKAYVADGSSGLQIVNISDSTAPIIIGSVDTPGHAWDVTLSADGTKAYIADGASGLQIIDISDPTEVTIIGSVDTLDYARDITLSTDGTKAFVADSSSGLQIIDISDPTAPTIIGSVDTPYYAFDVILPTDDTKAYVADGESGLQIIDISNSTAPTIIGSVDTPGYAWGVTLSTDRTKVYVADGNFGLQIIDISNPTEATIIDSIDTGYARGVTLSTDGTKVYVADDYSGIQIIDISNPAAPIIIDSIDTGYVDGVTLSADGIKAYVADGGSGLQIIDLTGF